MVNIIFEKYFFPMLITIFSKRHNKILIKVGSLLYFEVTQIWFKNDVLNDVLTLYHELKQH